MGLLWSGETIGLSDMLVGVPVYTSISSRGPLKSEVMIVGGAASRCCNPARHRQS